MKTKSVKDLMVPLSDYATVSKEATLKEALRALENDKKQYGDSPYRHRSLVVIDADKRAVGRVSQIDIIRALEPRYAEVGEDLWIARSRLTTRMLKTIREQFQLWDQPVETLCQTMEQRRVVDIMQVPSEGEFVDENDTMNIAMHRIVMGSHHSLLVTRGSMIVGILRSTDVFNALYDMMDCME
mgnify:CR=1 FL=1